MNEEQQKKPRKVGHTIRQLNHAFNSRFFNEGMEDGMDEVTLMHAWIMGYLKHNENRDIYQKTIESDFGICRSSVTNLVQIMEKKGYIQRECVKSDARLKRIQLTQEGRMIENRIHSTLEHVEATMTENIAPEDLATFYNVADQIRRNLKKTEKDSVEKIRNK